MNRLLILPCAVILLAGCSTNPEKRVPRAAADAMTGSPWTLTAVASLTMEGSGVVRGPDLEHPVTVTSFKRVLNFKKRQWLGDMTVLSPVAERISMGLIGGHAFQRILEGAEIHGLDPQLKSELLRHPVGFLQAAFSGALPLSGTRNVEGMDAADLRVDGMVYTLFLDSVTKLPAKISATQHFSTGDNVTETAFPAYTTIHGYKLPSRIVTKVGPIVIEDLKIEQQVASADAVELTIPDRL